MHIIHASHIFLYSNKLRSFSIKNVNEILVTECKNLTGVMKYDVFILYLTSQLLKIYFSIYIFSSNSNQFFTIFFLYINVYIFDFAYFSFLLCNYLYTT